MKKIVSLFHKVINSGLLCDDLIFIPSKGATNIDLTALQSSLKRSLCADHVELLQEWDGINLEVISLYSVNKSDELFQIAKSQISSYPNLIFFGHDPIGISYAYDADGKVYLLDSDALELEHISENLSDFFYNFIFGEKSECLMGISWVDELKKFKII